MIAMDNTYNLALCRCENYVIFKHFKELIFCILLTYELLLVFFTIIAIRALC